MKSRRVQHVATGAVILILSFAGFFRLTLQPKVSPAILPAALLARVCNASNLAFVSSHEKKHGPRARRLRHCPTSNRWRTALHKVDPDPHKTILSTGCNKGDDAIRFHAMFDNPADLEATPVFSLKDWWRSMKANGLDARDCGQCGGCKDHFIPKNTGNNYGRPSVSCIEASSKLATILAASSAALNYGPKQGFHVSNAAFVGSRLITEVLFPNGTSEGAMVSTNAKGAPVKALTLDQWADDNNVDILDILALDTEGFDYKVLLGASKLLANNRIRYLEFEVHNTGLWIGRFLKDLIEHLDTVGMVCFWATDVLTQISGCWDPGYDKPQRKYWSNVVCAPLHDPLGRPFLPVLESFDLVLGPR